MEVVLAHTNTDFDSLAAQLAVTKVYPGARMVPGHPPASNIRGFLALYRDSLPIVDLAYVDLDKIKHVYVVDCQNVERLDDLGKKLIVELHCPYTVFDHHQLDPNGLGPKASSESIIKSAGACTSLIVEKLMNANVSLAAFEATLLAIGIYEDSGCLTYGGTTELDARCVAYLLAQGADLNQINNFINPKLSAEQTELFQTMVANSKTKIIAGAKIAITHTQCSTFIEGLATMTRRLLEVSSADAAVSIVFMRDRVHLVGRSDHPAVNVRDLVMEFGGDGHPGAASAVVKKGSIPEIMRQVESVLERQVRPEKTAVQVMSSPVRTIKPDIAMAEAGNIMLRYGLDGLVVTEGTELVGVVSKRDIDKALHHKLGHAPVRGFMSRPVITIDEQTTLSALQAVMVKRDIGRLPVLGSEGKLVGMVTRKDVLHSLYGSDDGDESSLRVVAEEHRLHFKGKLEAIDEQTQWLFEEIGRTAASVSMVAYAVGGCVRDLFLGRENFDLDFVIEGNAITLAETLESNYPGKFEILAKHDRFQTATLTFHGKVDREIDLSTARTEFYEYPAALPTVEASLLEQDLFRRDFTINALAICVNPDEYGDVVDFFRGIQDIDARLIRILHPFSFIEDPTRIMRAVRFAARLRFDIEESTRRQAERAIAMGIFDELGGFRLKEELRLILESPERLTSLSLLRELGDNFRFLAEELNYDSILRLRMRRAERLLEKNPLSRAWTVYLGVLLSQLHAALLETVLERLNLPNDERDWIRAGVLLPRLLESKPEEGNANSAIYARLRGHADQSLAIAASLATPGSPVRRAIKVYLDELRHVKPSFSGDDLIKLGFPQGPEIKEALSLVLNAKLDGAVKTKHDELQLLKETFPQFVHA